MKLNTRHFGEIEVNEDRIIDFPNGLVAFDDLKKYLLIENEDKRIPFCWLQSLENPDLAFVLINPFLFKKDYSFEFSDENMAELAIRGPEDVAVFSITVIPQDIKKMTANLLAPIIINPRSRKGKQIILQDKHYSTKHFILEEMQKTCGEGCHDAGSDQKER